MQRASGVDVPSPSGARISPSTTRRTSTRTSWPPVSCASSCLAPRGPWSWRKLWPCTPPSTTTHARPRSHATERPGACAAQTATTSGRSRGPLAVADPDDCRNTSQGNATHPEQTWWKATFAAPAPQQAADWAVGGGARRQVRPIALPAARSKGLHHCAGGCVRAPPATPRRAGPATPLPPPPRHSPRPRPRNPTTYRPFRAA